MISRVFLRTIVPIVTFTSCGGAARAPSALPLVVYPAPPNPPRIQFLKAINTSDDVGRGVSFFSRLVGEEATDKKGIAKPYGVAIRRGKIYVCDTVTGGLDVIDLDKGSLDFFQPGGEGRMRMPINCFVDESDVLYVADSEGDRVVVFDSTGTFAGAIGEGEDIKPSDVFVAGDSVWVSDMSTGKVRVYDRSTGTPLLAFPDAEPIEQEGLSAPSNLYVTPEGVYVSDALKGQVNVYTWGGEYIRTVGGYGSVFGKFARPKGIAVDRNENLYVVDAAFANVQLFDREGNLLMFFGGGGNGPGDMMLPAKVAIDYDHLEYFREYVHPDFDLEHLIFVTNQTGPSKLSVYGFIRSAGDSIEVR
jgi:DNA-binding beta-propeller fold protein YncE